MAEQVVDEARAERVPELLATELLPRTFEEHQDAIDAARSESLVEDLRELGFQVDHQRAQDPQVVRQLMHLPVDGDLVGHVVAAHAAHRRSERNNVRLDRLRVLFIATFELMIERGWIKLGAEGEALVAERLALARDISADGWESWEGWRRCPKGHFLFACGCATDSDDKTESKKKRRRRR